MSRDVATKNVIVAKKDFVLVAQDGFLFARFADFNTNVSFLIFTIKSLLFRFFDS